MADEHGAPTRHVIRRGFTQIEMRPTGDDRIQIVRRKRKHVHGQGYKTVGTERVLFEGTAENACYVAEIVSEVFRDE